MNPLDENGRIKVFVINRKRRFLYLRWFDSVSGKWREESAKTGDQKQAEEKASALQENLTQSKNRIGKMADCRECGKQFLKRTGGRFCGEECRAAFEFRCAPRYCIECGTEFFDTHHGTVTCFDEACRKGRKRRIQKDAIARWHVRQKELKQLGKKAEKRLSNQGQLDQIRKAIEDGNRREG